MNKNLEKYLEGRNKIIIICFGVTALLIIIWIAVILIKDAIVAQKKKEVAAKIQPWMTALTPVSLDSLTDGYAIKVGDSFYSLPIIDQKNNKNLYYYNNPNKDYDTVYVKDDKQVPILDISTSNTNFVYKGSVLPNNYQLKSMRINVNYSAGIVLDSNNTIIALIGEDYDSKKYLGYRCEVLTNDSLKILDGEVYITDATKPMKVAFIKGTLYNEIVIKSKFLKGDLFEPVSNGKKFINLEITSNSYAKVLLTEEKYLPAGYYLFQKDSKSRYVVKLYNSDDSLNNIALSDQTLQENLLKKQKELSIVAKNKKLDFKFLIKAGIDVSSVTYTDQANKVGDYQIAGLGDKIRFDKDYEFTYVATQYYGGKRYYLGTITLSNKKEKNSAVIDVAIEYADYVSCYDYLEYRLNTYVEDKNEKEIIYNEYSDLSNFKGFTAVVTENGQKQQKVIE